MDNGRVFLAFHTFSLLLYLSSVYSVSNSDNRMLNQFISHYEPLDYNTDKLHTSHLRVKRSAHKSNSLNLHFKSHGRNFNLKLRPDSSAFSPGASVESGGDQLDLSHIYQGHVKGESRSRVYGSIIGGIFAGTIELPSDSYYVERADVYFDRPAFHSIIYAGKHVNTKPRKGDDGRGAHCAGEDARVRDWMNRVQTSAVEPEPPVNTPQKKKVTKRSVDASFYSRTRHNIYADPALLRTKRQSGGGARTCTMFMQSDTELWDHMTLPRSQNGLGYTAERAREEITSIFSSHIIGINGIYENTKFNFNDKNYTGINFRVERAKINESRDCDAQNRPTNPFCDKHLDVSFFLNLNSLANHDPYCLAYIFTYRDFVMGTLGLAWVGSPSRASGGICEKYKEYQEKTMRVRKSLNTGILTLVNYGQPVATKVSTLTFAHEVGHNFGSPHDYPPECRASSPGDPAGNFIMFNSATSGDQPNNNKFSVCSIRNITRVIDAVINEQFGKVNCFKARESAFCGNNIVEMGEDCDCGYDETECLDRCCIPRNTGSTRNTNGCTLRTNSMCSPTAGPCCSPNCTFISSRSCAPDSECAQEAMCTGLSASCPKPAPKANLTSCNKNTQVCISGVCERSICQKVRGNWEQCYVQPPEGADSKSFDRSNLCFVSCRNTAVTDSACVSTGDRTALNRQENLELLSLITSLNETSIKLPPGAPCENLRGYCDVFQKCRLADADGPLSRLTNIFFNQETFTTIREWITTYWYFVVLIGVGVIILMVVFVKVCSIHTPSSNPKLKPARKISLKPPTRHQGPPPPYTSEPNRGGPPHGKGKGRNKSPQAKQQQKKKGQQQQRGGGASSSSSAGPSHSAAAASSRGVQGPSSAAAVSRAPPPSYRTEAPPGRSDPYLVQTNAQAHYTPQSYEMHPHHRRV